jgi:hypothetical protein
MVSVLIGIVFLCLPFDLDDSTGSVNLGSHWRGCPTLDIPRPVSILRCRSRDRHFYSQTISLDPFNS